jgi:hypothetical protein
MAEHDCIWCRIYKKDRDKARDRLARALSGEEHILVLKLRREVQKMQRALEQKNRALDAMHWVWCDGGCEGGVHRFDGQGADGLTQEIVDAAVRNTERLQRWWRNRPEIMR